MKVLYLEIRNLEFSTAKEKYQRKKEKQAGDIYKDFIGGKLITPKRTSLVINLQSHKVENNA